MPLTVQNYVRTIAESGYAEEIILFGSRARGDHRENSDFDFVVKWKKHQLKEVLNLTSNLDESALTLYKIDLLSFDQLSKDYVQAIEREGKLLWQQKA